MVFGINKEVYSSSLINIKTKIKGNIEVNGEIIIRGSVEGTIIANNVILHNTGFIKGKIEAPTIHILGTVDGIIKGSSVLLSKTARIKGDILHKKISMETGAIIDGNLKKW